MTCVLLAVVFYTIVKFGFEAWSQLRYEFSDKDKDYYDREIRRLSERINDLEDEVKSKS